MTSVELYYSSDEEQSVEEALQIKLIRKNLRDNSNPMQLDNQTFIKYFRLSKPAFQHVLESIESSLKVIIRERAVPNIIKLAATLRFFAHGNYQISVGNDFNIGIAQSTVSEIFKDVFNALETKIATKWIDFQYTEDEYRRAKLHFYEKSGIPNITGCVDGTHIRIVGPGKDLKHLYYNRKGFYSVNAMIVCDHLMNIRFINAKNPGATHDATVWNMSALKNKIHEDYRNHRNNVVLLGDGGYALTPYLLTPYRNAVEGSLQARFNTKHSRARNIVERTIGLLKGRFRCLLSARELHYTPEKATQIANICAALHNICLKYNVDIPEIEVEEDNNDNVAEDGDHETLNTTSTDLFNEGSRIRDRISSFM